MVSLVGWGEILSLSVGLVSPMGRISRRILVGSRIVCDFAAGIWSDGKMGREEQIEEREVLDSIFPDEITGEPCCPELFSCDRNKC